MHELAERLLGIYLDHWMSDNNLLDVGAMHGSIMSALMATPLTVQGGRPAESDIACITAAQMGLAEADSQDAPTSCRSERYLDPSVN